MRNPGKIIWTFIIVLATFFISGNAIAGIDKARIASICTECHKADSNTIWGLLRAGSQEKARFDIETDKDVWHVSYDKSTKLNKLQSLKQLRDEEAVMIKVRSTKWDVVYAEEVRYKPNLKFKPAEMVIEIDDMMNILKKDPEEANYVLYDVRGYGDYLEGHIPGAVSLPYYRFGHFKDRLPKDRNTHIITYCNGYG